VLDEIGLYFLQRDADFPATRLGNKTIPKILEPGSMLFQVDEDGDLPSFAIRDELNSSHGAILPYGRSASLVISLSLLLCDL
jgi:hypothetical protein